MDWKEKIKTLPIGYSEILFEGKKYTLTRQDFNNGRSIKIYAEEAGGKDFISFNYYITTQDELLKPCEMPEEKVISFLEGFVLITSPSPSTAH